MLFSLNIQDLVDKICMKITQRTRKDLRKLHQWWLYSGYFNEETQARILLIVSRILSRKGIQKSDLAYKVISSEPAVLCQRCNLLLLVERVIWLCWYHSTSAIYLDGNMAYACHRCHPFEVSYFDIRPSSLLGGEHFLLHFLTFSTKTTTAWNA